MLHCVRLCVLYAVCACVCAPAVVFVCRTLRAAAFAVIMHLRTTPCRLPQQRRRRHSDSESEPELDLDPNALMEVDALGLSQAEKEEEERQRQETAA